MEVCMMINGYRKTEVRARRVARAVLIPLIGVLLLVILLRLLGSSIESILLPMKEVQIYGNSFIKSKELLKIMKIESNRSLLFFNKRTAKMQLLADGRVAGAELLKVWPGTLKVYVAEKEKKFQLLGTENRYWVSADGVVLGGMEEGEEELPPLVTLQANNDDIKVGEEVGNFLVRDVLQALNRIEKTHPDFYRALYSFTISTRGIELYVKGRGYRVYLGNSISEETLEKLRTLLLVLENSGSDGLSAQEIREIDLSFSYAAVQKEEK